MPTVADTLESYSAVASAGKRDHNIWWCRIKMQEAGAYQRPLFRALGSPVLAPRLRTPVFGCELQTAFVSYVVARRGPKLASDRCGGR